MPVIGGISYFPLNCQLDEKFELIEAEFGLKGFAVVVKLLQRIYGEHGYYCEWTKEVGLLFSRKLGFPVGDNSVSEIVETALKREIFSDDLFQRYRILTSRGIQTRYLDAVSRRKKVTMKEEYLLVPATHLPKNVDILSGNVYTFSKNDDILQQRKEEREKERKREKTIEKEDSLSGDVFSTFEHCGFHITGYTKDELLDLTDHYSAEWVIEAIKRAADRGKRSMGYVRAILSNWEVAGAIDDPQKPERKLSAEGREVREIDIDM